MADGIFVTGVEHYKEALAKLQTDNPKTKQEIQRIIRNAIGKARRNVIRDAQGVLENDPRQAYKAVRNSVYKQVFGGQINILPSRKRGAPTSYVRPRKLDANPHQRGGNRRPRVVEDAMRIDSYHGVDRGFILRFQNAGTVERESRYGKRGSLRPRNWFGISSAYQMDAAADEVAQEIENMLQQEFHQI